MADSKHTPGEWSLPHFAKPEVNCECGYVLTDGHMGAVCTVHASGDGDWQKTGDNPKFAEAVANAYLIHAAPDLLEAAKAFVAGEDALLAELRADGQLPDLTEKPWSLVDGLRAAIAKATGSSDFHITERRA
jgi:hypothetical protein